MSMKPWSPTDDEIELIRGWTEQKITKRAIARRLGITHVTLYKAAKHINGKALWFALDLKYEDVASRPEWADEEIDIGAELDDFLDKQNSEDDKLESLNPL